MVLRLFSSFERGSEGAREQVGRGELPLCPLAPLRPRSGERKGQWWVREA